jgi:hypothetical protein
VAIEQGVVAWLVNNRGGFIRGSRFVILIKKVLFSMV